MIQSKDLEMKLLLNQLIKYIQIWLMKNSNLLLRLLKNLIEYSVKR